MEKTDMLLIVNPKSGVDRDKERAVDIVTTLCEERGLTVNVEFTTREGDAQEIAIGGVNNKVKTVIAAGGDGTVREVANGLWGSKIPMGIIPMGSGNGLARSLCIPQEIKAAVEVALSGQREAIDRGVAGAASFYSAFGIGFDAEVSYRFSLDKRRGKTTYLKHAIRQLFSYRPSRFRLVSENLDIETEALLVAVCNCKQYGNNAYISPDANPADGFLDVTVIHEGNFLSKAMAGIELFSGTLNSNVLVEMFRVRFLQIEKEGALESIVHLDGEPAEMKLPVDIRCEERGLEVIVPWDNNIFRPYFTPLKSIWDDLLMDIRKNIL